MPAAAPDPLEVRAALGRVAVLLARCGVAGLPDALALLVAAADLRSAVLRRSGSPYDLLAAAGEVVHAVPLRRAAADVLEMAAPVPELVAPVAELPVRGPRGPELATLTLPGAARRCSRCCARRAPCSASRSPPTAPSPRP